MFRAAVASPAIKSEPNGADAGKGDPSEAHVRTLDTR
jgi:hypothetical protein